MRSLKKVLVDRYFGCDGAVEYQKDDMIDAVVREWWIYNGMPTFLTDKIAGRYVRRMLRAHKLLALSKNV
jgi:hypothetical protein